jgi:pyrroline-5-carboxylate reductase
MQKVLMIGCGNMGGALLKHWHDHYHVTVVKPSAIDMSNVNNLNNANNVNNANNANSVNSVSYTNKASNILHQSFDIVVIAIKPQAFPHVLPEYVAVKANMVVSIAAGVSIGKISRYFPDQQNIIRAMPNLATMVQQSITALLPSPDCHEQYIKACRELFAKVGITILLDDDDGVDKFTAVAGSGTAYICYFIEQLIAASQNLGFSEQDSGKIVLQTMYGAGEIIRQWQLDNLQQLAQLRSNVTSKGGTTEAGLEVMMNDADTLKQLLDRTINNAYKRSKEIQ